MPPTHPEYRRRLVELARVGGGIAALAREFGRRLFWQRRARGRERSQSTETNPQHPPSSTESG